MFSVLCSDVFGFGQVLVGAVVVGGSGFFGEKVRMAVTVTEIVIKIKKRNNICES